MTLPDWLAANTFSLIELLVGEPSRTSPRNSVAAGVVGGVGVVGVVGVFGVVGLVATGVEPAFVDVEPPPPPQADSNKVAMTQTAYERRIGTRAMDVDGMAEV
ncbi:MAG: hypothetical protein KJS95_03095 [Gammaproteobacteria bacterium]|nr:hypothetical protein [Gammaproteobacteria bacterium]